MCVLRTIDVHVWRFRVNSVAAAMRARGGRSATAGAACWPTWWHHRYRHQPSATTRQTPTCCWTWPVPGWRWTGRARAPGSGAACPRTPYTRRCCPAMTCSSCAPRSSTWWPWSTGPCSGCRLTASRTRVSGARTGLVATDKRNNSDRQ